MKNFNDCVQNYLDTAKPTTAWLIDELKKLKESEKIDRGRLVELIGRIDHQQVDAERFLEKVSAFYELCDILGVNSDAIHIKEQPRRKIISTSTQCGR